MLISPCRYLKCIDRFYQNYVSCWITGGSKPTPISQHSSSPPDVNTQEVRLKLCMLMKIIHRRQIPPSTRALATRGGERVSLQHVHRRQPDGSPDRGGHQAVLHGGVRELGQDDHEPLLSGEHGGAQPGFPVEGGCRGKEVPVREGMMREFV